MSFRREFVRDGERLTVQVDRKGDHAQVRIGERSIEVDVRQLPDGRIGFDLDGTGYIALSGRSGKDRVQVRVAGFTHDLEFYQSGGSSGAGEAASGSIEAPMTGTIVRILVREGQAVEVNETVAVLTAMKMEHKLKAAVAGTVSTVAFAEGDTVDQGVEILRIDEATE